MRQAWVRMILSLALLPACLGLAGASQVTSNWQAEWERVLEAATKEGQLLLYIGGGYEAAVRVFQKKYPNIKVTTVTGSGNEQALKVMAERRAGKYLADIYSGGSSTPYSVFYQNKALDPVKPAFVLPEVRDESKWWRGKHHFIDPEAQYIFAYVGNVAGASVQYNTNLVNPNEFKSYWDLLDQKWRGKIESKDPKQRTGISSALRFFYYHPKLGPKFVKRLYSEMDITIFREGRVGTDWLANGKFPICIACTGWDLAKNQGLSVDEFKNTGWVEGSSINLHYGTLSLFNRAPHPNAAKVFINWFLSREGQTALQEVMKAPSDSVESLRIDIRKDMIPLNERRAEGVEYLMLGRPEFIDMGPMYKVVDEALREVQKK